VLTKVRRRMREAGWRARKIGVGAHADQVRTAGGCVPRSRVSFSQSHSLSSASAARNAWAAGTPPRADP
jgi:hypothetical protein